LDTPDLYTKQTLSGTVTLIMRSIFLRLRANVKKKHHQGVTTR